MDIRAAFDVERCLRRAWDAFQRQPLGLLLGSFLLWLTDGGSGGGNLQPPDLGSGGDGASLEQGLQQGLRELLDAVGTVEAAFLAGVFACVVVVVAVVLVFRCWLLPGWLRLQRACLLEQDAPLSLLFGGGDALLRMIGWKLLHGLIGLGTFAVSALPSLLMLVAAWQADGPDARFAWIGGAGALLLMVPASLYVGLGTMLGDHFVALGELGALDALDQSWEMARGNRARLAIFAVLTWLPNILGCLACCIGMVFTRCLQVTALTEAWLVATGAAPEGPGARQAETGPAAG
jgi:hypothetical protein